EFIVGSDDMTPEVISTEIPGILAAQKKIAAARQQAGVEAIEFPPVEAPDCSVAGQEIDNGNDARCFAQYLRIHALRAANGLTYAQMGRFMAAPNAPQAETDFNGGTSNEEVALVNEQSGQPLSNRVRDPSGPSPG